ncbi:hypothetical protein MtrunA17_Chr8g0344271 [Medicago truncatula]|uniref:Uncharacterized protein n=1 Tax=Medicago truncatula TaxID=3880 RepID=A0A396GDG7_MEDTR|nr:hypothetical protein MtrunA17_Chr8g0344271 [Medicago truncatula]
MTKGEKRLRTKRWMGEKTWRRTIKRMTKEGTTTNSMEEKGAEITRRR